MLFTFTFLPDSFHYLRPEIAWVGRAAQLSWKGGGIKSQVLEWRFSAEEKCRRRCKTLGNKNTTSVPLDGTAGRSKDLKHSLELFFKSPSSRIIHSPRKHNKTSWIKTKRRRFSLRNMLKCNMRNGHIHTRHLQPLRAALMRPDESAGLDTCCK